MTMKAANTPRFEKLVTNFSFNGRLNSHGIPDKAQKTPNEIIVMTIK